MDNKANKTNLLTMNHSLLCQIGINVDDLNTFRMHSSPEHMARTHVSLANNIPEKNVST